MLTTEAAERVHGDREARERKAAEPRARATHFPTHKTLERIDFAARPSINRMLFCELVRCEYIDRRENVLFAGKPGTGKTHLATAWTWPSWAGLAGALPPS